MPQDVERGLQQGVAFNRQGRFAEALPLLQASVGRVAEAYAASFNLALAYLGVGQYRECIRTLKAAGSNTGASAQVDNLLAQAYIGIGETELAFAALKAAAAQTPRDERLYAFVADACTDHSQYALGVRIADLGLKHLPDSARLHYERAMFLAKLDRLEEGNAEFAKAAALAPGSDIAYLARVQAAAFSSDYEDAARIAREGIASGHRDYQMQSLLGSILLRKGAAPGEPAFAEARAALEQSVEERPGFATAQIMLGKADLLDKRYAEAVQHLEAGKRLQPLNPEIYPSLATAYRRLDEREKAEECLAVLAKLLEEKAAQR